jgi:ADP-ribose pyrophosphatase
MAAPTTRSRSAKSAAAATKTKSTRAKQVVAPKNKPQAARKSSSKKAHLISSKLAYKGKVFSVYTDKVEEPGGSINERDVIRHNGSVVILAIDEAKNPSDPDVILERQYRHAADSFCSNYRPAASSPTRLPWLPPSAR